MPDLDELVNDLGQPADRLRGDVAVVLARVAARDLGQLRGVGDVPHARERVEQREPATRDLGVGERVPGAVDPLGARWVGWRQLELAQEAIVGRAVGAVQLHELGARARVGQAREQVEPIDACAGARVAQARAAEPVSTHADQPEPEPRAQQVVAEGERVIGEQPE